MMNRAILSERVRSLSCCRPFVLSLVVSFFFQFVAVVTEPVLAAPSKTARSTVHHPGATRWRAGSTVRVSHKRHSAFRVPEKMKPRVKFWIDVFARYGEYDVVIHHRMYPHVIFDLLDMRGKKHLSEKRYLKERKRLFKAREKVIAAALKRLGAGHPPRSTLEKHIAKQMASVPGGKKKYTDVVKKKWIRSQIGIKERYREAIERSGRYIHILEKVFVTDYGLPIELTRLPFVESSFDYKAYSSVGAAGIWQFMPGTGRLFNLRVSRVVDERRDVTAATRAAARYLLDAYGKIGTWPLALTSYNHGVYGVLRKIKKLRTKDIVSIVERADGQLFGFASQNFYPEFLAALEIYDHPQKYFPGVRVEPPREISRRRLPRATTISELTKKLQISKEELKSVNYALHSKVWSGRYSVPAGYTLNVPSKFHNSLAKLSLSGSGIKAGSAAASNVYGGLTYKVRRGDTLGKIAKRYGTRIKTLKNLNGLRSDFLRVGQLLVVEPGSYSASSKSQRPLPSSSGLIYKVKRGDSLFKIARSHRTTVSALKSVNGLSSSQIRVGQILKLPSGAPSSRTEEVRYRVRRGDSLWKIGQRHGVSVQSIRARNGLRSNKLSIGQYLTIPR